MLSAVAGGAVGIAPIANIPTDRLTVKIAAEVKGFDPLQHFEARRAGNLDRGTQFTLVATREAIKAAGLPAATLAEAGVNLGATRGWVNPRHACITISAHTP